MSTDQRKATVPCASCGTLNRVRVDLLQNRPACGKCRQPLALDHPIAVTDSNFDRVIADSAVPIVVDFYADWCGPCHAMAPVLDEIARQNAGAAIIVKLDTDRSPNTSLRFGIRGIPTLIAFAGGREVAREVGAVPRPRVQHLIDQAWARARAG